MKILITGSAGFIGSALSKKLLERGDEIVGVDNINDYYDVKLKKDRLKNLKKFSNYTHHKINIFDKETLEKIFKKNKFKKVVNLAAQAGVRYSLENPDLYIQSNVVGFLNIIENCKKFDIKHLVYASTSSVYGANLKMPFSEQHSANHPLSLYAASKKTNELIAHSYSHLYKLPTTGLRFFTVYGPWGRPDMALFKFTKAILNDDYIELFNNGKHSRDFTYIDDIVQGIILSLKKPTSQNFSWSGNQPDPSSSNAPWNIYNIGNGNPIQLMDYIKALEKALGKKAKIKFLPLQLGDMPDTFADVKKIKNELFYEPKTSVIDGISKFAAWYKGYYSVK